MIFRGPKKYAEGGEISILSPGSGVKDIDNPADNPGGDR